MLSQATKYSLEKLIRTITEKAPHVLFFEGAEGKTPLDWSRQRQIDEILEGGASKYARYRYLGWHRAGQILNRPLFSFGTAYEGYTITRKVYDAWEIVRDIFNSIESKPRRKLITKEEFERFREAYVPAFAVRKRTYSNICEQVEE
jgi:hypothetical protein